MILQVRFLAASESPNVILYFAIGIAVVVILVVVGTLINRARSPRSAEDQARYSGRVFRKTAKAMGLQNNHVDALLELIRICKVKQPFLVFTSAGLLDDVLKKGMYSIDSSRTLSEEDREKKKAVIFQIKQLIEGNARQGTSLKSTHFLKPGQALTITPEGASAFASKVVSNMKDFLSAAAPAAAAHGETRWTRGTKLSVYFWRENDAGYSFVSKVLGYDSIKGVPCMLVQHAKALRKEQRRRNRRKPIQKACFYYPIRIVESGQGRNSGKKAMVESNLRALGTVVDLSAGGCAIQTLSLFEPGKLIMIEFDIDKKAPIRAYGKVRRVRRVKGRGGVMHVMFTNVTRQYLNRIFAFVYDFGKAGASLQGQPSTEAAPRPRIAPPGALMPRTRPDR